MRLQISHLKCVGPATWGNAPELLERIDKARSEGLNVAADQYPYTANSTNLAGAVFPRWAQVGGRSTTIARLDEEEFCSRLREEIRANFDRRGGADMVVVASYPPHTAFEGMSLSQIAEELKCDPMDAAIRLYRESETPIIAHSLQEDDVVVIAGGAWVAVGSDGSSIKTEGALSAGKPHPRSYGTFPRFLARYVREQAVVTLEEAIRKMTLLPASRLGLTQRGRIVPGMWADLAIFDPDTIADTATFESPHSYAAGMPHVVVNGVPVVKDGVFTGATPGKVLRDFND